MSQQNSVLNAITRFVFRRAPPDAKVVPAGLEPCRDRENRAFCNTIKLNHKCEDDKELAEKCEMTCGRCG